MVIDCIKIPGAIWPKLREFSYDCVILRRCVRWRRYTVPVKNLFSWWLPGFGTKSKYEFVLMRNSEFNFRFCCQTKSWSKFCFCFQFSTSGKPKYLQIRFYSGYNVSVVSDRLGLHKITRHALRLSPHTRQPWEFQQVRSSQGQWWSRYIHGCMFSYEDITLILFRYDRSQKCLGGQKRHDFPQSHCPPDRAPQYDQQGPCTPHPHDLVQYPWGYPAYHQEICQRITTFN